MPTPEDLSTDEEDTGDESDVDYDIGPMLRGLAGFLMIAAVVGFLFWSAVGQPRLLQ